VKNLSERLRQIVRENRRELTVEPDLPSLGSGGHSFHDVVARSAEVLGGTVLGDPSSACLVVDRVYDADRYHGKRRVESYRLAPTAPLSLFEPKLASTSDWASRTVFFDIETTGLSGGAGTVAFLVGCGWFEGDAFRVRQWVMLGPAGERPLLDALGRTMDDTSLLVTFNGRTFDVPFMETRWAFHRQSTPTDDLPHFDMLPAARRLWSRREDDTSCSLTALERSVLGFHRVGDVPGFEIPVRYFQFLRTGDASIIDGVLEHNRLDLISLAAVTARAFELASEGPQWCREACEQLGLGHLYERQGDLARAEEAFSFAAVSAEERDLRSRALERLALLRRRARRFDEAATAWQHIVDRAKRPFSAIERRAAEALAIYHEHRANDLVSAQRYAQVVRGHTNGRRAADVEHRLGRLAKKLEQKKQKGDQVVAPLLDSENPGTPGPRDLGTSTKP
jgi:uncharacterized protein YprB with RNaseH-like and TPR domain